MNNNQVEATLLAHAGARKITREELSVIEAPPATKTHKPVAHREIVEAITGTLALRQMKVVRDEYAVSSDGMKMFGILEVEQKGEEDFRMRNYPSDENAYRFAIGIRNSNDKSMRLGLTAGYRVLVCDNMAFSGDFEAVFYKHTKRLELSQVVSLAVDGIQRNFAPLRDEIHRWQSLFLSNRDAKIIIYDAFRSSKLKLPARLIKKVHKEYFEPEREDFTRRTLWKLLNAFTGTIKEFPPVRQFEVTARLGSYFKTCFKERWKKDQVKIELVENPIKRFSANGNARDILELAKAA